MAVKVRIPTPLQKFTGNAAEISAEGFTVTAMFKDLEKKHAGICERILDEKGNLRRFINVFVNGEDVRFLQGMETSLKESDEVSIVPAIAGG